MKIRVFKAIGIVFGSVLALAGAIVGVLAIMGKFKVEQIYPDILSFEQANVRVVYDETNPQIHSFKIIGSSSRGEVNNTTCYLQPYLNNFTNQNVITICDEQGTPLEIKKDETDNTLLGYEVECNKNIYFKVNSELVKDDNNSFGITQFMAIGDKDYGMTSATKTPLTISVDRLVKSLYVGNSLGNTVGKIDGNNQTITLNLGSSLKFENWVVANANSVNPISNLSAKQIYIYYRDTEQQQNEYVLLTETSVNNYSFLKYSSGKFVFQAPTNVTSKTYTFMLAMYPTYDALFAHNNLAPANYDEIRQAVYTTLTLNVENTVVENITFPTGTVIGTDLYNSTLVSLNDTGTLGQNLGLTFVGSNVSQRYNSIGFEAMSGVWSATNIFFKKIESDDSFAVDSNCNISSSILRRFGVDYEIHTQNITYTSNGEEYKLINKLTQGSDEYRATGGAAFLCKDFHGNYTIKLLQSGEYFDFMYSVAGGYELATDFNYIYEAQTTNAGLLNSWNITPISEPASGRTLNLFMLVVNSDGTTCYNGVNFTVTPKPIEITTEPSATIYYGYASNGSSYELTYSSTEFNSLVNINSGSYTACAFVIEYTPPYTNYPFELLKDASNSVVTLSAGGKTYAIVGYKNAGNFVNEIKATSMLVGYDANSGLKYSLYVAQFKNDYESKTGTDYITNKLGNLSQLELNQVLYTQKLELSLDYDISEEDLALFESSFTTKNTLTHVGDKYYILQGEEIAEYTVSCDGSVAGLLSKLNKANLKLEVYQGDILSTSLLLSGNDFSVDGSYLNAVFNVAGAVSSGYRIKLSYNGVVINTSKEINIVNGSTNSVNYQFASTETGSNVNLALNDSEYDAGAYLNVKIRYEDSAYAYSYKLVDGADQAVVFAPILNSQYQNENSIKTEGVINGFSAFANYSIVVQHDLSYAIEDTDIAEIYGSTIKIKQVGTTYLIISSTSTTTKWYLKIVIEAGEDGKQFALQQTVSSSSETTANLTDFVSYTYGTDGNISTELSDATISSVKVLSFGGGNVTRVERVDDYYDATNSTTTTTIRILDSSKETDNEILKIERVKTDATNSGWILTRGANYLYTSIKISFNVSVLTLQQPLNAVLEFNYSLYVSKNEDWNDTYYAGTQVLVAEIAASNNEITANPMFKIIDGRNHDLSNGGVELGNSITIKYVLPNNTRQDLTLTDQLASLTLSTVGKYQFEFYLSGSKISTATIYTKENYFALTESVIELNSNSDSDAEQNLTIYSYNNSVLFGSQAGYTYNNFNNLSVIATQVNANLETIISKLSLNYSSEENKIISLQNNITSILFHADFITNLNESAVNFNLTFSFNPATGVNEEDFVDNLVLVSGNKQIDCINISVNNMVVFDESTVAKTYMAEVNYSANFEISNALGYSLTNITFADDVDYAQIILTRTGAEGTPITNFKFKFINSEALTSKNVALKFEFSKLSSTLTYTTGVAGAVSNPKIEPYKPNKLAYNAVANNEFNLIDNVFGTTFDSSIIKSIIIISVDKASLIKQGSYANLGYTYNGTEWQSTLSNITFAKITGNKAELKVNYLITYVNNATYEFEEVLEIKNDQEITVVYPYNAIEANPTEVEMQFSLSASAEDQNTLLFSGSSVLFDKFETIYLKKKKAPINNASLSNDVILNLGYDELLSLSRISNNGSISNIEKIAWWNYNPFYNYTESNVIINKDAKQITFIYPVATQSWNVGYVIFKITTEGGATAYYKVVVHYYASPSTAPVGNSSINNYLEVQTEGGSSVATILSDTDTKASLISALDIKNQDVNNISYYLVSAKYINGNSVLVSPNAQETEIKYATIGQNVTNKIIEQLTNHATIKLVAVYKNSDVVVNVGCIILYITPTLQEELKVGFDYINQVSYQIDGTAQATTFNTGTYVGEITNQTVGLPFNNTSNNFTSATITKATGLVGVLVAENIIKYGDITILKITNNYVIEIENYLDKDIVFDVVYYTNSGLECYVQYTLKALKINVASADRTMQGVNSDGYFEYVIDPSVSSLIGGVYNKNITITDNNNSSNKITLPMLAQDGSPTEPTATSIVNVEYKYSNGKLNILFKTNLTEYNKSLTIELDNYYGTNKSIELNVNVQPSIVSSALANSESLRVKTDTTIDEKVNYSSLAGSKINVAVNTSGQATNYLITSNGTTIANITAESTSINIGFALTNGADASAYVVNAEATGHITSLEITETTTINFAHSAKEGTVIILSIIVYRENEQRYTQSFEVYVEISQTYTSLQPNYEFNGSDHDVRLAGETISSTYLFEQSVNDTEQKIDGSNSVKVYNKNRLTLYGVDGNAISTYNLIKMGFANSNNINYVILTPVSLLSPNSQGFAIGNPGANNLAQLRLSNQTWVGNVNYNIRVLSSSAEMISGTNVYEKTEGNSTYKYLTLTRAEYEEIANDPSSTKAKGTGSATLTDSYNNVFFVPKIKGITLTYGTNTTATGSDVDLKKSINGQTLTFNCSATVGKSFVVNITAIRENLTFSITGIDLDVNKIVLDVDLYGSGLVAQSFKIVYINKAVQLKSNTFTRYGEGIVQMQDMFDVSGAEGIETTYKIIAGNYTMSDDNGGNVSHTSEADLKSLFSGYDATTNIINSVLSSDGALTLNTIVANSANINLTFQALADGFVIKTLNPTILATGNIGLKVNGTLINDDSYCLYYAMDEVNLINEKYNLAFNEKSTAESEGEGTATKRTKKLNINTVNVVNGMAYDLSYISNVNVLSEDWNVKYNSVFTLTTAKDYTGTFVVQATINRGSRGKRTFSFQINVTGFASFSDRQTDVIGIDQPLNSGSEIRIVDSQINQNRTTATGIIRYNISNNPIEYTSEFINISDVEYVSKSSSEELWASYGLGKTDASNKCYEGKNADKEPIYIAPDDGKYKFSGETLFTELPYITSLSNTNRYIVYKLTFKYHIYEVVRYATYYVKGSNISINTNENTDNIVVDDSFGEDTDFKLYKKGNEYFIPLFYNPNKMPANKIKTLFTLSSVGETEFRNFVASLGGISFTNTTGVNDSTFNQLKGIEQIYLDDNIELFGVKIYNGNGAPKLFNNIANTTLQVIGTGGQVIKSCNIELSGETKLYPNNSKKLSEIFAYQAVYPQDISIVSIVSSNNPQPSWINGANAVGTGTGTKEESLSFNYHGQAIDIYSATWSDNSSSTDRIYSVSDKFYYAVVSGGNIYVLAKTNNTYEYNATATSDTENVYTINLGGIKYKPWNSTNSEPNEISITEIDLYNKDNLISLGDESKTLSSIATISGTNIIISEEDLKKYCQANSTSMLAITVEVKIVNNNITIPLYVNINYNALTA